MLRDIEQRSREGTVHLYRIKSEIIVKKFLINLFFSLARMFVGNPIISSLVKAKVERDP